MDTAEQLTSSEGWQRIWHWIWEPLLRPVAALPQETGSSTGPKRLGRLQLLVSHNEFARGSGETFLLNSSIAVFRFHCWRAY
jgi:hypothetical protein